MLVRADFAEATCIAASPRAVVANADVLSAPTNNHMGHLVSATLDKGVNIFALRLYAAVTANITGWGRIHTQRQIANLPVAHIPPPF